MALSVSALLLSISPSSSPSVLLLFPRAHLYRYTAVRASYSMRMRTLSLSLFRRLPLSPIHCSPPAYLSYYAAVRAGYSVGARPPSLSISLSLHHAQRSVRTPLCRTLPDPPHRAPCLVFPAPLLRVTRSPGSVSPPSPCICIACVCLPP